jgi:probable rRNA maturation factor
LISVYNAQKDLPIKAASVKRLVSFVLQKKKISCQGLAIYFVSKRKIAALHDQFFQDPTPTDCITFPHDDQFLGEIFVCPKVAQEYDPKHPLRETTLYIIHGILHLLGYDDLKPKARARMHKEQMKLLKAAGQAKCSLEA